MNRYAKLLKPYAFSVALVALAAAVGLLVVRQGEKNHARAAVEGNEELLALYDKATSRTKQINEEPNNFEIYNAAMFNWKSLGDATGERYFYKRALNVAKKAQKKQRVKSALFSLNAGNIYKIIGDFDQAAKHYEAAVQLNTGDANMWLPYLDLYTHWDEKKPAEVITLFDRALSTLLDRTNVTIEKAAYLRSIGELKQSLALYESLQIAYPDNPQFVQKVTEVKLQIANQ